MTDIMDFTPAPSSGELMDFTVEKPRVQFKIDGDVFVGVRDLPAMKAMEFSGHADKMSDDNVPIAERIQLFTDILRILLVDESAELFIKRLGDANNPIGIKTMLKVVPWLFEQYAQRPTTPDSDSSAGSGNPESGTSSTVSTSAVGSTS